MVTVEYGATAEALRALYRDYDWWDDRDVDEVRRALEATDETVLLRDEGDPVASARVLTDHVYYAMVYDVLRNAKRF